MRYLPTSGRAKLAAMVGLASAFFGTFCVGLLAFTVIIGIYSAVNNVEESDPAVVAEAVTSLGAFDSSALSSLQPRSFRSLPGSGAESGEWTDDRLDLHWLSAGKPRSVYHWREQSRTVRIEITNFPGWLEMNLIQFKQQQRYEKFRDGHRRRQIGSEHLTWKFLGEDVRVSKITFEEIPEEQNVETPLAATDQTGESTKVEPDKVVHYCCMEIIENEGCGFSLMHKPAKSNLTEAQIQAIFESYRSSETK